MKFKDIIANRKMAYGTTIQFPANDPNAPDISYNIIPIRVLTDLSTRDGINLATEGFIYPTWVIPSKTGGFSANYHYDHITFSTLSDSAEIVYLVFDGLRDEVSIDSEYTMQSIEIQLSSLRRFVNKNLNLSGCYIAGTLADLQGCITGDLSFFNCMNVEGGFIRSTR